MKTEFQTDRKERNRAMMKARHLPLLLLALPGMMASTAVAEDAAAIME